MNVKAIKVSKMTSHCAGTEQVKKSEIALRRREEIGFETRTTGRERWSSCDQVSTKFFKHSVNE